MPGLANAEIGAGGHLAGSTVVKRLVEARVPPRLLLAAGLVVWGLLEALLIDGGAAPAVRCLFAVLAMGSIAWIDRYPWAVLAVQLGALAVNSELQILDNDEAVTPLQGIVAIGWIAGAAVARTGASVVLALALAAATIAVGTAIGLPAVGALLGVALGWGAARVTRTVRERHAGLERRLAEADGDPDALARHEVDAERARLARELDLVVLGAARRIDAEAGRAGAALGSDPAAAGAALEGIAVSAGGAMARIREALALLRADGGGSDLPADPDALAGAVAALRSRGARVEIHDDGTGGRESALALTRVLQLAAAAPERPRRVRVRSGRGEVAVRLRYAPADPAANRESFVRMRERAQLYGGSVRLGRRGRSFAVRLPAPGRSAGARPGLGAAVAAGVIGALTVLDLWAEASPPPLAGALAAVALSVAAGAWAWTRRPLALAAFAWLPVLRDLLVGFEGVEATTIPLLAAAAFLPSLWIEDSRPRRLLALDVGLAALALLGVSWLYDGVILTDVPIVVFIVAAAWWIGFSVRAVGSEADRLAAIGWATTRAEIRAARGAVEDERRRIARDLHDLVAHGLAIVSVQAWGAKAALAAEPRAAREALGAIREAAGSIVGELERLTGPDSGAANGAAAPSLDDLVAGAREAGLPLSVAGELPAGAPAEAEILGGVVREALTNVIRHAGLVATTVALRSLPGGFEAEVRNAPGRTEAASGGLGLAGMRERLAERGGELEAGPLADGGFRVLARLPLRREAGLHPKIR